MLTRVFSPKYAIVAVGIFACVSVIAGCGDAAPTPTPTVAAPLRETTIAIGYTSFTVEVADTPTTRERGLMARTSLAADRGMLFVFDEPQPVTFWMKDTLIPLDILYFDDEKKLQQIYADTPPCERDPCATYPSTHDDIRYVVEIKAGAAAARGITVGETLEMR